ncbi:uncharacterized protein [Apostichopus japonicus]|uniref:uncharacterized protein isoform X3 n=1 Tax=Stichopus japonicus TaxID=307972 RepID=UPI003AB74B1D
MKFFLVRRWKHRLTILPESYKFYTCSMDIPSSSSSEYGESQTAGFIETANEFLLKYGLDRVSDLAEVTASVFVTVYELILGDRLEGVIKDVVTREDEINNIQRLIDSLANDFLHCDLSHITGVAVADGRVTSIQYLLEIFLALEAFLMEQISLDSSSHADAPHEEDLDVVTMGTAHAISEVLREEGISSPPTKDDTETSISLDSRLPSSISGGDLEQHQIESDLSMEELINLGDRAVYGQSYPQRNLPPSTSAPPHDDRNRVPRTKHDYLIPSRDETGAKPSYSYRDQNSRRDPFTYRDQNKFRRDDISESGDLQRGLDGRRLEAKSDHQRNPQTSRHVHRSRDLDGENQQCAIKERSRSKPLYISTHQNQPSKVSPMPDTVTGSVQKKSHRDEDGASEGKEKQSNLATSLDSYLSVNASSRPSAAHSMNTTSSTVSSAAWPEPPSSKDRYALNAELASVGTGIPRTNQESRKVPTQQHTHTHHHYHQPVVFEADRDGRRPAPGGSLPISRPPSDRAVPLVSTSSSQSPPAAGASSISIPPKCVKKDYPSRDAFISLTPPAKLPREQSKKKAKQENMASRLGARSGKNVTRDRKAADANTCDAKMKRDRQIAKSRSWDNDNIERSERTADERSLHMKNHRKSKSVETEGKREPGPSKRRAKSQQQQHPERKVAFHLEDEAEEEDDETLAKLAVLSKLRARLSSSDDEDDDDDASDSAVAIHSDSIIDYQTSPKADLRQKKTRRLRRKGAPKSPVSGSLLQGRSPPRVRFEDALDSQAKGTMGKIRRKIGKEKKVHDIERKTLQFLYSAGLKELQREMEEQGANRKRLVKQQDREYKRKVLKKPKTSISRPAGKYSTKLLPHATGGQGGRRGQRAKRKRSPSPRFRRQKRLTVGDDEVLPVLLNEFPFLHVSPETAHSMWTKQLRQVEQLTKLGIEQSKHNKLQKKVGDAEQRQKLLVDIMKKDLAHNQRMREIQEKREKKTILQRKERERRQVTARARRYYDEFRLQAQSRMAKRKTKEEKIFRNLFDEALKIQKSRIGDLRKYARDKREDMAEQEQFQIDSMENYYRDQFNLLAETLEKERYDLSVRDNAQARVLDQMRRAMRRKMEDEIRGFQEQLYRDEDTAYFRQLEADRMKARLRSAAYKTLL